MSHVLLVNDDDEILDRTATMLIDLGWEVYVANGDDKVFESIVARRPDLLIVDVEIERGDGFKAISTARRLFPSLFIVAVTRGGHKELWSEGVGEFGPNIYVIGPVSKNKLATVIKFGFSGGHISCESPANDVPDSHSS